MVCTHESKQGCEYSGDWKDDLYNGEGQHKYVDFSYKGTFKDGKKHGEGKLVLHRDDDDDDGDAGDHVYEGSFVCDKFEGKGTYTWAAGGGYYCGNQKDDAHDGQGKVYGPDGVLLYDGNWKDDEQHGEGKEYIGGKLRYEGSFKANYYDGKGKQYAPDGASVLYEGEHEAGKRHGEGKEFFGHGDDATRLSYDGGFKENKYEGRGRKIHHYTQSYTTQEWTTTQEWHGIFKGGKKEGEGKLLEIKVMQIGTWKDDKLDKA